MLLIGSILLGLASILICCYPMVMEAAQATGLLLLYAAAVSLCLIGQMGLTRCGQVKHVSKKLRRLMLGSRALFALGATMLAKLLLGLYWVFLSDVIWPRGVWIADVIVGVAVLAVLLLVALICTLTASGQLTARRRLMLLILWWLPLVNVILFFLIFSVTNRECSFQIRQMIRNRDRKEQQVCHTKYPLLMVHGIFFRDWEKFNYWGRIPQELEENGAVIFYGNQQSSASVEESAKELRDTILQIIEKERCEKVNIIAHSKGGLDSRYAISLLDMGDFVASLTTVNTPHRGCRFAKKALEKLPEGTVSFVSRTYDEIFVKLGDEHPDFYSGVSELTDETCEKLNESMPDVEGVFYQSIGSQMSGAASAAFPLNLGYGIIKALDGDNDGLVATTSMPWGERFMLLKPEGKKGISHGDVIDLTRKNIPGFDVCECYVDLVRKLKDKGL